MIVVGLSHQSAPISVRERLAIPPHALGDTLARLRRIEALAETVVLSTCNRVEVYAVAKREASDRELLDMVTRLLGEIGGREVVPHLMTRLGSEALRHLFRVASSLDSLVVGEPQILGQLKDAIRGASDGGALGPELHLAMRAALSVAKRVRTETAIGQGQVSVPSVAVDLARHIFDEMHGHTALLVGAGEMAETAAKLLARAGASLLVVNRNSERAEQLAASVGGTPAPWSRLADVLVRADIVVASTASPTHVITKQMLKGLRRARRGRSLFLIDIAVPRDVEPAVHELDNVYLYDIDDLSHVVAQSLEGRRAEAQRAEQLVARETDSFELRKNQQSMKPIIVGLRKRTRSLLGAELERTMKGRLKDLGDKERQALEVMLDAAVNKLLHEPTRQLKNLAGTPRSAEVAELISTLFNLEEEQPEVTVQETSLDDLDLDDEEEPEAAEEGLRLAAR